MVLKYGYKKKMKLDKKIKEVEEENENLREQIR